MLAVDESLGTSRAVLGKTPPSPPQSPRGSGLRGSTLYSTTRGVLQDNLRGHLRSRLGTLARPSRIPPWETTWTSSTLRAFTRVPTLLSFAIARVKSSRGNSGRPIERNAPGHDDAFKFLRYTTIRRPRVIPSPTAQLVRNFVSVGVTALTLDTTDGFQMERAMAFDGLHELLDPRPGISSSRTAHGVP